MSADQAKMVRDARGMPEFIYNPRLGETSQEAFSLKGNPSMDRDWWRTKFKATSEEYNVTVAHWAITEGRFRKHLKSIKEEQAAEMIHLDDMLVFITQDDVIYRRVFDPNHRSYVPNFGVYFKLEAKGKIRFYSVSRQMVLFAVERRKAWRMLQSKAGVVNKDYLAQKSLLKKLDAGEITLADAHGKTRELFDAEVAALEASK
jgi:pyruvate-ferredoxin/flavodoxin oxidoreductase